MVEFFAVTLVLAAIAAVWVKKGRPILGTMPVTRTTPGAPSKPAAETGSRSITTLQPIEMKRMEVRFAGQWKACQFTKRFDWMPQLCLVRLSDRRTTSREIVRDIREVREVSV